MSDERPTGIQYNGNLYGKAGGEYFPLVMTSDVILTGGSADALRRYLAIVEEEAK